jgi:hypothetical protein
MNPAHPAIEQIASLVRNLIPKNANVPTDEGANISALIALFFNPSPESDPREIMRRISDALVEYMVKHRSKMPDHPMMKMIFQLFLIEWCFRNGHMEEDWKWEWDAGGKRGEAKMNMKVPINKISLPSL